MNETSVAKVKAARELIPIAFFVFSLVVILLGIERSLAYNT